ncbi:Zinc finger, CCHC domain-containing protein, partial [Linnemannia exigua]
IDKKDMKSAEYSSPADKYLNRLFLAAHDSDSLISDNDQDNDDEYSDCESEDHEPTDDDMPDLVTDDETCSSTNVATTITNTKTLAKPTSPAIKIQAKPTAPTTTANNGKAPAKSTAPTTNGKASTPTKPTTKKANSTDDDIPDLLSDDDYDDLPDLVTDDDDNGNGRNQAGVNRVDKGKGKANDKTDGKVGDKGRGKGDSKSNGKVKVKENGGAKAKSVKKSDPVEELSYSSDGESTDDQMPELRTDEDTRVAANGVSSDDDDNEDWTDNEEEDDDDDDDDDDHNGKDSTKTAVAARLTGVDAPPIVKDVIAEAMERIIQAQKENRAEKEALRVAQLVENQRNQNPKQKERQRLAEKTEKLSKSLIDQAGRNAMLQITKDHASEVAKEKYIQKKASEDKYWAQMDAEYKVRVGADQVAKAEAEKKAILRLESERAARAKAETERILKEKAEAERVAKERAEAERVAKEKAEAERVAKEKAEAERVAKEKAERLAREKAEADRIAKEKAEHLAREKAEADRVAREKAEAERLAREKAKAEKLAREKAEAERLAREKAERLAREKAEADRIAKERAEAEKVAKERAETERIAREKAQAEQLAREKADAERLAKESAEEAKRVARVRAEADQIVREVAQKEAREKTEVDRLAGEKADAERAVMEQAAAERLLQQRAEAERVDREKAEADRQAKAVRLDLLRKNLDDAIAKEAHLIDSTKETINQIILDQSMAQNMHLRTEEQMAKQAAEAQRVRENAWVEKMAAYDMLDNWSDRKAFLQEAEAARDEEGRKAREAINSRSAQWAANVANSDRGFEARFDTVQAMIDPLSRARVAAQKALDEAEEEMLRPAPIPAEKIVASGPDVNTISAIVDGARAAEDARVEARRLKQEKAKATAAAKAESARQKEEIRLQKEEAKQQKRLESREKTRLKQEAEKTAIELAKSLGEPVRVPMTPGDFSYDWQSINFTLPIWKVPLEHLVTMEAWVEHWYPQLTSDDECLVVRQELLARLQSLFDAQFPDAGLQLRPFGSYVTGLANKYSDIDICIFVEPEHFHPYAPHSDVRHLAWFLENQQMQSVVAITDAKVPIVKFIDPITEIHCDMNVQHPLGIYNSALIKAYMEIDVRLEKFLFLLKYFAKVHGIHDGSSGYLCSYAYILMAIVFFQEQAEPILPRLQVKTEKPKPLKEKGKSRRKLNTFGQCLQDGTIQPVYVNQDGKVFDCTFDTRIDLYKGFGSQNKKPVSRLLFEFFEYFSRKFDYRTMEVSSQYGRMQERHVIVREKRQLLQVGKLSTDRSSSNNNKGLLPANGNNNVGPMTRNGYYYDTRRQLWVSPADIAYFHELEASGITVDGTNGVNGTGVGSPGLESPGMGAPPSPSLSTTSSMSNSSTTSTSTTNSTSMRSNQAFFCVMDPFIYSRNVGGTCRGQKLERVWRCFDHGYRSFALGEFSNAFEPQEFETDAALQLQQHQHDSL